ncbi:MULTISPECIES: hypothetical protein [Ralstonia]|uniref:hypothetical protein n=1 Tax=Ralstonia TaxID=48736 RepID=UPI0011AEC7E0|nr:MULTISPECIES: hypothetical protein [Ralstonia]
MTSAQETNAMQACRAGSPPVCGEPLLHEPDPENLNHLTPDQVELYLKLAETAVRLVRDDIPFEKVREMFGEQIHYSAHYNEYTFVRPELKEVFFNIGMVHEGRGATGSVDSVNIEVRHRLVGIDKKVLEKRLELTRPKDYVSINLMRQWWVDFMYETGNDLVSCYPTRVYLNYFKDEGYSTLDPRTESEAKYLGKIYISRFYLTPEEKLKYAQRIPQCRSREPAPRSGLWRPSIPHDVPYADYFKRYELVSMRLTQGQPMYSVGLGRPADEARVLWTWVGE